MISIVNATHLGKYLIRLEFSDGSQGDYDFWQLIKRDTAMVRPLANPEYFQSFFLELGAICWPNGFDLSPGSLHQKLREQGRLRGASHAA